MITYGLLFLLPPYATTVSIQTAIPIESVLKVYPVTHWLNDSMRYCTQCGSYYTCSIGIALFFCIHKQYCTIRRSAADCTVSLWPPYHIRKIGIHFVAWFGLLLLLVVVVSSTWTNEQGKMPRCWCWQSRRFGQTSRRKCHAYKKTNVVPWK